MNQKEKFNFKILFNPENEEKLVIQAKTDTIPLKKRIVFTSGSIKSNLPILDTEITKIFDKFNDPLGLLLIARESESPKDLVKEYRLTSRELEVIGTVVNGWKTRRISEQLEITERTVKSHITSIYQKTGASSRVELLNLVMYGKEL